DAVLGNPQFPLHQVARKYGVQYIVAGHIHQMLRVDLDGITYLSLPSAGVHLRLSKQYEDGWFFGFTIAEVHGNTVTLTIKDTEGRTSSPSEWGAAGLLKRA